MLRHLGYVGIALSIQTTSNRTTRLRNATPERLRELIADNLAGLREILQFNHDHAIYMFRISSQIIPFASHPANQLFWWDEFAAQLAEIGQFVRDNDMRVSMHPGQFTTLSATDREILDRALLDVEWHMRFLEALRVNAQHKVVLHLGGVYGDKDAAKDRFVNVIQGLPPSWHRRLVIENDERLYTVDDVLEVCKRTALPAVFDYLHYLGNQGSITSPAEAMRACFDTWKTQDGVPKVHYSDQDPRKRPGSHSEWINAEGFAAFLAETPDRDFDCMLEAKKKDLALLKLRAELASRGIVEERSA